MAAHGGDVVKWIDRTKFGLMRMAESIGGVLDLINRLGGEGDHVRGVSSNWVSPGLAEFSG